MQFPSKVEIVALRKQYPIGTKVELVSMNDKQAPPAGTIGRVWGVDDAGSILVRWENGSSQCRANEKTILHYERGWNKKPKTKLANEAYEILKKKYN